MAQLYSLHATRTPGDWLVTRVDPAGRCVAEYVVSRLRPQSSTQISAAKGTVNVSPSLDWPEALYKPIFDPPQAFGGYDNSELDNTIPTLPPTG